MKILRLELFGFKSFKDKTIITFNQPITAIVGSNGCGKSNVVDALYWVMGDMSPKHLRGHHMSDVIFSGSKDAAALDMAEVTLVLEREPEKDPELPPQFNSSLEIQITRRYYRNGESEYAINKTHCRLRDIQEFFMDTGLGAKAYSIIEQGAITRMVAQKPEERRTVIEEVAGIMKFKARKAETQRKIEGAQTNLGRIDDIVKELQKQLSSLKRQADKAEKFKSLSEELQNLEVRLLSRDWKDRKDTHTQSLLVATELRRALEELSEKQGIERLRLENVSNDLGAVEEKLGLLRDQSRQAELSLKDSESEIASLNTQKDNATNRMARDKSSLDELLAREETLKIELETILAEIESLSEQSQVFATQLEDVGAQLETLRQANLEGRAEVDTQRKRLHTEELEQTRLTQQIQNLQKQIVQLNQKQDSISLQLNSASAELDMKNVERHATVESLEAAFASRSDLEKSRTEVTESLNQLEQNRNDLQQARDIAREKLSTLQIKRKHLEQLDQDFAGVDAAAKSIARHFRNLGENNRLLADSISVPESLEKIVEIALGKSLQRVKASTLNDVENLRSLLVNENDPEARAARLPLWISGIASDYKTQVAGTQLDQVYISVQENVPAESAAMSFSETPGPDGLVSQTTVEPLLATTTQTRVLNAKNYLEEHPEVVGQLNSLILSERSLLADESWLVLLRDFWVVKNRAALIEIAQNLQGLGLQFITTDGDVLSREGYLDLAPIETNLSGEQSIGLVQRKREISELKSEESDASAQLQMAQEALDLCLKHLHDAKNRFRELTANLAALDPDVERHSLFLRQVETQIARLTEKQNLLNTDLEKSQQEQKEISERLAVMSEELATAELRHEQATQEFETSQNALSSNLEKQNEMEAQLSNIRREAQKIDRLLSEKQSSRAALEQEKMLSTARCEQIQNDITSLTQNLEELAEKLELAQMTLDSKAESVDQAKTDEQAMAQIFDTQKLAVRQAQEALDKINSEIHSATNRLHDVEQSVAVNDVEIRNLSTQLQDKYQLALDAMEEAQLAELLTPMDIEEAADPDFARNRIGQLRTKIDNLGKINMVAAEEFGDLSARYEYLFIQREDLANSIQQLQDAIDRINRESRERFAEAFNLVNMALQKTFPILFGGGNAELRLTNPDDLLETGVEIVAQPPGKKLQSVTLLSGGEKALTAVSLIFGIFSIKPSPFCVLDEVDAPLDDANVGRFNTQVRKMSDNSQIIVISHRKKTMESCDAVFGVTMERPGISKVASAKLGDL